jgi:hypothetical protein
MLGASLLCCLVRQKLPTETRVSFSDDDAVALACVSLQDKAADNFHCSTVLSELRQLAPTWQARQRFRPYEYQASSTVG